MSSGGPTSRMYKDKKTPMKRVRNIGWQTSSNPERPVKRIVEPAASLPNGDRAGLATKHSLPNVARLLAGVRNLADHVKSLLDFAEPEFDGNFFFLAPNPQPQQIAGLLFLQPAIHPPGHFAAIPVEDDVSSPQASLGSRT